MDQPQLNSRKRAYNFLSLLTPYSLTLPFFTAPNVLAHPWSFERKCVLGAGGKQNREGAEQNDLGSGHQ
jgi:hypothetical protein